MGTRVELTKKEQLEKAFKILLNVLLTEYDLDCLTGKKTKLGGGNFLKLLDFFVILLIREVTIRTNLK